MRNHRYCYILAAAALLCGCQQHTPSESIGTSAESTVETSGSTSSSAESTVSESTAAPESSSSDFESSGQEESSAEPDTDTAASTEDIGTTAGAETDPPETEAETSMIFYNCDDVMYITKDANIRTGPGTNFPVYDVYPAGTAVQCIAKSDEWVIVSIGTGTYYISAGLLSPENPAVPGSEETSSETAVSVQPGGEVTSNGILYTVGAGPLVCIDAGHQGRGNSETEPDGPGSSTYKAKVATGTSGAASGLTEAQLNLMVSLQLRDELLSRGYNVLMVRESQEVNISNAERAQMANNAGADILVRIHANGSDNPAVSGVLTMSPTAANPYIAALYPACHSLSECVVNAICTQTGAVNRGVYETDTMSGINWAAVPVTIVEMGYMTNPAEDLLMASADYQAKIVAGIANGIDSYFGR